eukprot:7441426-Heterocapsa_arctica.AAC.1
MLPSSMLMPMPRAERRASRRFAAWRPRLKAVNADLRESTITSIALSRAAGVDAMMPIASSSTK